MRRTLKELTDVENPAWPEVVAWFDAATVSVQVIASDPVRSSVVLERLQISLGSALGAQAFHTGGVFVDHKWIRLLGSGSPAIPLDIVTLTERLGFWASIDEPPTAVAFAVDAVGGIFAINGGAFGGDGLGMVFYFSPDGLTWENLHLGHSAMIRHMLSGSMDQFYESLRWKGWEEEAERLNGDRAILVYPPLWSVECRPLESAKRADVPLSEVIDMNLNVYAPAIASGETQFTIKARP